MERISRHKSLVWLLMILPLAVTACGAFASSPSTPTPVPTVDENRIIARALAEVETRFVRPTATPVPTLDPERIKADLLTEVQSRFVQPTVTPVPTLDPDQVAEVVLADVEVQSALAAAAQGLEDALKSVYQKANPSVVLIIVQFRGSGSGFVYGEDGYIVTNNHVVADGNNIEVVFSNGERHRAETVGTDADSDLAVIKVDALPEDVDPLPLAAADELQVGQFVVAIGNPFGAQGSMSLGIVSGLGRSLPSTDSSFGSSSYSLPQVVQTDAPINPGNSGGPLLNLDGEVVGVNAAIASLTGTNSGVGFSIPVAAVRLVAPSLIENGQYRYPYMGVGFEGEISLDEQEAFDLPQTQGAYILSVTEGGPADEAGLIPASSTTGRGGDLIVRIDDQEIRNFSDLNSYLVFHTQVGQTIDITVLRDGETMTVPLTLSARP